MSRSVPVNFSGKCFQAVKGKVVSNFMLVKLGGGGFFANHFSCTLIFFLLHCASGELQTPQNVLARYLAFSLVSRNPLFFSSDASGISKSG